MRLAIIITHPIQYYAPMFKLLQEREQINISVFYTWGEKAINKHDPGFGKTVAWDIPLLEGYDHEFLKNTSASPGSSHFKGIINPDAIQRINAFQPNAILVYGWSYQSHLKILRHYKGRVPVWFRGDSNLIDKQSGWKALFKKLLLRWVYSHVLKAFYVGSANKAYFKKYGLREDQLMFAPHAIDNDRFSADRKKEALRLRAAMNLADDDILILFAGKLELKKNPELLLDAFTNLRKEKAHLLFVGNGALEGNLKLKAESDQINGIHFMDFQNQQMMPVIYQACDLFCLPSKGPGETWGLAVNEAMACSKAILVSDKVGCAVDLVKDDYNGKVFEAQSLTSLTRNLESLLNKSKKELTDMGLCSKKIIDEWTFQKQVAIILSAIDKT